jgi:hypothetical protein
MKNGSMVLNLSTCYRLVMFLRIFLVWWIALTAGVAFAGLLLVTPEEMQQSNAADSGLRPRGVSVKDAPLIDLVMPKLPGEVSSPTRIELRFIPTAPSTIKPETFRALYGTFGIDITSRIVGVTRVTAQGIEVQEANLPKGKHRIQLLLEDSEGRVGSRWMEFQVN